MDTEMALSEVESLASPSQLCLLVAFRSPWMVLPFVTALQPPTFLSLQLPLVLCVRPALDGSDDEPENGPDSVPCMYKLFCVC